MVSTVSSYFKCKSFKSSIKLKNIFFFFVVLICLVLLCTFIQLGNTLPTLVDDDEDQTQVENSFVNNYGTVNDRLNGKIPFEDFYYHKKPFNSDNVQLAKRIIMLPRVGRRSIRST
jgi:hypothetical protein